jgi:hypothetical protein
MLYRKLIYYTTSDGSPATYGGLADTSVAAESAESAATEALRLSGPQVRKTWSRIEVIPFLGRDEYRRYESYGDATVFERKE